MEISDYDLIRFWFKVDTGDDDKCWNWTAGPYKENLYGSFGYNGKNYGAHVFSYLIHKGPTNGLFVCHTCDNRKCVNPNHLWLGTIEDNRRDMIEKGRQLKGENINGCKLNKEQVLEIREKYLTNKYSSRQLAKDYNVYHSTILRIINKKTWKHI